MLYIIAINTFILGFFKYRNLIAGLILIATLIVIWQKNSDHIYDWLLGSYLSLVAPTDLLIEKFELTVFRNDYEAKGRQSSGILGKWDNSIRMRLVGEGTKQFVAHIEKTLDTLSHLSGLSIRLNEEDEPMGINMDFHFVSPDRAAPILRSHGESQENIAMMSDTICFVRIKGSGIITKHGIVVIFNTLDDAMIRHCIVEEITQGLGLIGDSDILQPSIMSDDIFNIDRLPMNDKIMVRTLYDKRLNPGMTRDEAMPIVSKIIPELDAAVKERGEEALYQ